MEQRGRRWGGAAGARPEVGRSVQGAAGVGEARPRSSLLSPTAAATPARGRGERNEKPRVSTVGFSFLY